MTGVESLEAKLLKFETYVLAQLMGFGLPPSDARDVAQEILCGAWIVMAAVRLRREPAMQLIDVFAVWARATCKWQATALLGSELAETAPRTILLGFLALPAEYREALTLTVMGAAPAEIAARLNVNVKVINRRIVVGRGMLVENVEELRRGPTPVGSA